MAWRSRLPIVVSKKEERDKSGRLSQREIARQTGIRQATISEWMNWGVFKRLDADVVAALAEFLNCKPEELYEWVSSKTDDKFATQDLPSTDEEGRLVGMAKATA